LRSASEGPPTLVSNGSRERPEGRAIRRAPSEIWIGRRRAAWTGTSKSSRSAGGGPAVACARTTPSQAPPAPEGWEPCAAARLRRSDRTRLVNRKTNPSLGTWCHSWGQIRVAAECSTKTLHSRGVHRSLYPNPVRCFRDRIGRTSLPAREHANLDVFSAEKGLSCPPLLGFLWLLPAAPARRPAAAENGG